MRVLLAIACAVSSAAAADADSVRLARIRYHMAQNLTEMPNYTCTQTIERSRRPARGRRFQLLDTLRLEVALVNGAELFAWPGSGKFEDRKISEMVGGTIGNGVFAGHARSVFMGSGASFEFLGEQAADSSPAFRYRYDVPLARSNYTIKVGDQESVVAYSGYFETSATSLDLREFQVRVTRFPSNIPLTESTVTMRYAHARIGERDFTLPETADLVMTDLEGTENRNLTRFSGCRQYSGESVVRFDDPVDIVPGDTPVTEAVTLPPGLILEAQLNSPVAFGKTAIGDYLECRLTSPARIKGRVMVPKGATLRARVVKLERGMARTEILRVGLRLEEVEFPGAKAFASAILEDAGPTMLRSLRVAVDRAGIIWITGNTPELARGMRLVWRVTGIPTKEQQ